MDQEVISETIIKSKLYQRIIWRKKGRRKERKKIRMGLLALLQSVCEHSDGNGMQIWWWAVRKAAGPSRPPSVGILRPWAGLVVRAGQGLRGPGLCFFSTGKTSSEENKRFSLDDFLSHSMDLHSVLWREKEPQATNKKISSSIFKFYDMNSSKKFSPVLLRYNWYTALCKFQVYNIVIWLQHIVKWLPQV